MAKQDSTPKESSGGGYLFENEVVAYVLAHLLSRSSPFAPPGGLVERVDVRPKSEWHLDDLLVTARARSRHHRMAYSVKSNRQITSSGFPGDFIREAWEQLLHDSSDVFNDREDYLGLITAPVGPALKENVFELLRRSRVQEPKDLAFQVPLKGQSNDILRQLHESAQCPEDLAHCYGIDKESSPGRLLRRMLWLPFDFEEDNSQRRGEALRLCRDCLSSGSANEATGLWGRLTEVANDLRRHRGGTDLPSLIDELRGHFNLKDFPDFAEDWRRIDDDTTSALRRVVVTIGGRVHLPRTAEHVAISEVFEARRIAVALGASGTGKSAIAREEAEATRKSGKALWLDAGQLGSRSVSEWQAQLGLTHPLREVVLSAPTADGLLVLDGLDRVFNDEPFATAVECAEICRVGEEKSPWRLLITCTQEQWPRVRDQLASHGLPLGSDHLVPVGLPDERELREAWSSFPKLASLRGRRHLAPVLQRPKVLDLLATHSTGREDLPLFGESHVARLLWDRLIASGSSALAGGEAARCLAVCLADDLQPAIRESEITRAIGATNLSVVDQLVEHRVLIRDQGKLWFDHDLYGDWIRGLRLRDLNDGGKLAEFLEGRMRSPVWHRALRLLGIDLFEQSGESGPWMATFHALGKLPNPSCTVAQDLLLESTAFASGEGRGLLHAELWPFLSGDGGTLLARLLRRILQAATAPNPLLAVAPGLDPDLSARFRVPTGPYWFGILTLLHDHREEIPPGARSLAAQAADLWLRYTPPSSALREQAAAVAVAIADARLKEKEERENLYADVEADRLIYRAVLASGSNEPDRVTQIVLEAAGRRSRRFLPPAPTAEQLEEARKERPISHAVTSVPLGPMLDPWPHGPRFRVDASLQEMVLEQPDALVPLIHARPDVARELLLALLISAPRRRRSSHDDIYRRDLGLAWRRWYPPFYWRGPFLSFLQIDEAIAVTAILQLVAHATDRWAEAVARSAAREGRRSAKAANAPSVEIEVEGKSRTYTGDSDVFRWYLHGPLHGESLVSALVALEKHLYDRADAGEDLTPLLRRLLMESRSLAIVGVLAVFGCRHPRYFLGPLEGLLGSPELLWWSHSVSLSPGAETSWTLAWDLVPGPLQKLFQTWHQMEHRRISLVQVTVMLLINDPGIRPYLHTVRERLLAGLRPGGPYEEWTFAENLAAQLDLANYKRIDDRDARAYLEFTPPEELQRKQAHLEEESARNLRLIALPIQCRKLLDEGADALDSGTLEQLWGQAQQISTLDPAAVPEISPPTNSLAAVAAVVVLRGNRWRLEKPERGRWAEKVLLDAVREKRHDEFLGGATQWDRRSFAAEALPAIWAEDGSNREVREAIARLACQTPREIVERLTIAVARVRNRLPKDHQRLLRAVLLRSGLVPRLQLAAQEPWPLGDQDNAPQKEEAGKLRQELAELEAALMEGTLEPRVPPLEEIAPLPEVSGEPPALGGGRRVAPERLLDEGLALAAYRGLPYPEPGEEQPWLRAWSATAQDVMAPFAQADDEATTDADRSLGTLEWELMPKLAAAVASVSAPELGRLLWNPIVEVGASAADLVSLFGKQWTLFALHPAATEPILKSWLEMIDAALVNPRWAGGPAGTYLGHQTGEMWRALLGFAHCSPDIWTEELRPHVRALQGRLETWTAAHLTNSDNARAFAQLLELPAFEELCLIGLVWLHQAAGKSGEDFWGRSSRNSDTEGAVLSLLSFVWSRHRSELRRASSSLAAFQSLLEILVSRQNAGGLELADRVGALR